MDGPLLKIKLFLCFFGVFFFSYLKTWNLWSYEPALLSFKLVDYIRPQRRLLCNRSGQSNNSGAGHMSSWDVWYGKLRFLLIFSDDFFILIQTAVWKKSIISASSVYFPSGNFYRPAMTLNIPQYDCGNVKCNVPEGLKVRENSVLKSDLEELRWQWVNRSGFFHSLHFLPGHISASYMTGWSRNGARTIKREFICLWIETLV